MGPLLGSFRSLILRNQSRGDVCIRFSVRTAACWSALFLFFVLCRWPSWPVPRALRVRPSNPRASCPVASVHGNVRVSSSWPVPRAPPNPRASSCRPCHGGSGRQNVSLPSGKPVPKGSVGPNVPVFKSAFLPFHRVKMDIPKPRGIPG